MPYVKAKPRPLSNQREVVFSSAFARLGLDADAFAARQGYVRDGAGYRATGDGPRRVAVFCHGGLALTWLAHLLAIPPPLVWAGFSLAPASVTTEKCGKLLLLLTGDSR